MSDDWKVGDLAVCVDDGPAPSAHRGPRVKLRAGNVYEVSGFAISNTGRVGLLLDGEAPRQSPKFGTVGWRLSRFRKIRPDEHEACEAEFVELLKRSKRKVEA